MGLVDELKELHPALQILLGLVVLGVGLVVVVAVLVVLAAIVGSFVLGVGGEVDTSVQAGATVTTDETAGTAEVVWTSNQNADHLIVEWSTTGGDVAVGSLESAQQVDEDAARIGELGGSVTLAEDDPDGTTTISITVTAVGEDGESVILTKDVEV